MNSSSLVIKKLINATCQQIFEAWSKPESMQQWLFPPMKDWKARASNEFKVGGSYKLEMLGNDGNIYTHTGEYKEIIPNKKIVFTWNSHVVTNTLVTVELREETNGKTEITLTHDLLPNKDLYEKHQGGWHGCFDNLEIFLKKKDIPAT
jgi:uncharacterized protein YndB with AHSA1/START domain